MLNSAFFSESLDSCYKLDRGYICDQSQIETLGSKSLREFLTDKKKHSTCVAAFLLLLWDVCSLYDLSSEGQHKEACT